MNIKQLTKEVQDDFGGNGLMKFIVYKTGRSWNYADLWECEDNDEL